MKHICCDDGSTNVKLAWFDNDKLNTFLSPNSFRPGWKIEGMGSRRTFNYQIDGVKYTFDDVSHQAISTTNIEYQYSDTVAENRVIGYKNHVAGDTLESGSNIIIIVSKGRQQTTTQATS